MTDHQHRGRRLAAVACLALGLGSLTACKESTPNPMPLAQALAAGLTSGDLAAVPMVGTTPALATAQIAAAVKDMKGAKRVVTVKAATATDSKIATATLSVTWDVDATPEDWTYQTTARFQRTKKTWSLTWSPTVLHPQLTAGSRLALSRTVGPRADILGAGGSVIVTNRAVRRVGIDKTKLPGAAAVLSATALAKLVAVDPVRYAAQVSAAGPKAFVEAIVLRMPALAPVAAKIAAIPGAVLIPSERALAPTREFARPIIGSVGDATAEIVKSSKGRIRTGDQAGLSGLEQRYDTQLSGVPGVQVQLLPAATVLYKADPVPGKPVTTTLEMPAQTLAEKLLATVQPGSALVAIRPSTGNVVAAASGPGTNGYSAATLGKYPPGSTFKVVTTLALLRAGLTPSSPTQCTRSIVVDGKSFKNYSDYPANGFGTIPLRTALANSCNTAFMSQAAKAPQDALVGAAASLGLGPDHDLGLPAFLGSVPAQATAVEHAASMIGQAKVEASPLAMAAVVASVAKGATVVPRLIVGASQAPADGAAAPRPLTAAEGQVLRQLMVGVVQNGSGHVLADVPGPAIGAKTGTAEFGTDTPRRTHGWMIAFQGDLAVAVFVEDAVSGSHTAGPILEAFLRGMQH